MSVPSNSRGKDRGMTRKPKFRVGQVVYEATFGQYVRLGESFMAKNKTGVRYYHVGDAVYKESTLRALTKRERGDKGCIPVTKLEASRDRTAAPR